MRKIDPMAAALAAAFSLATCQSQGEANMQGLATAADGRRRTVPEECPVPEGKPLIEILKNVQDRYYGENDETVAWDESLSYFQWVWTPLQKKKLGGTHDVTRMVLQWKDVEVFPTGEFATVSLRGVIEAVASGDFDPAKGGVFFEGKCFFRKFPEG